MVNEINLAAYKSSSSTIYTGRPQGQSVREKLNINKLDETKEQYKFIIPNDTTSFNPSFYLGLLFKSYEKLGVEGFDKKYSFVISTEDNEMKKVLQNNLDDGRRYAINSLTSTSGLRSLFKKK